MRSTVKRRYVSQIRSEQASATRDRVLAATQKLFRDRGYAATSIAGIAREAKVSVETVYAVFGSKRELLAQMVAAAIAGAGEDEKVPMLKRAWVAAMREKSNQAERLRYWIGHTCETLERTSSIHAVIGEAAGNEPALAKLKTEQQRFRLNMQKALMELITESGRWPLRLGVEKSAETFWVLASPELHTLLRVDLGWPKARYQAWLTDALETLLLPPRNAKRPGNH